MAELKTVVTEQSVGDFLEKIPDDTMRQDCQTVAQLMQNITGHPPKMWGSSIVGFGQYHYKYASGQEGDWFSVGFSPRKQNLTLYLASGLAGHEALLQQLGKHKTGQSCLYVKKLKDIDIGVLRQLIEAAVASQPKTS
jgi:hypothetical protein